MCRCIYLIVILFITWDFCAEFHTSTITYLENKWEFISLVRIVKCVCWKQLDDYLFIRKCVLMCCWDVFTSQIYSEKNSLILYIYPTQKTRHNQSTQNTFYNDNFFLSPTRVNTSHCIANIAIGQGQGRLSSIFTLSSSHRNCTQTASFIASVVAAAAVWQNIYSSHFEVKFTSPKIHSYKQGESLVATMEYTDKRGRAVSRICGLMIIL